MRARVVLVIYIYIHEILSCTRSFLSVPYFYSVLYHCGLIEYIYSIFYVGALALSFSRRSLWLSGCFLVG